MKTPQDHLWQLIQRLSPAEKRYFRRHFGFAGNQLTQLYDLLNQQPAYDEDAARRTLDVPAAAYKVLKAQLMELLLKSLLAEEGKRPPSARLHLGLEEVRLLQQRHLFVEAERRLQRLHKWAERHQLTHELPLITEKIGWTGEPTTVQLSPHERAQRMQLCGQLWQYRTQWLNRAGDWDAPQWLAGMQAIDWPALSFPDQLLYWEWLGDYWRELDQPQSALQAYQQGLQPFIESPELAAAHPWAYLQLLRVNADYLSWQIPVPPQLYVITDLAEQHLCGFPELEPQRLHFLLAKMRALFLQQHWQAIIQRKETIILSHLERFQLETTSAGALVCLLLANTYLVLDNPSRVQYYMRRFQAASHLVEKPLRYTANILELISHWETNDVDLVEQRIRTMRRQLRQDQDAGFSPFYQLHLELITRLVRQPYERTRFASEVLLRIPDFQEDPIFPHYKFQNLERWVQAAAARRPLAEVIRSRPA